VSLLVGWCLAPASGSGAACDRSCDLAAITTSAPDADTTASNRVRSELADIQARPEHRCGRGITSICGRKLIDRTHMQGGAAALDAAGVTWTIEAEGASPPGPVREWSAGAPSRISLARLGPRQVDHLGAAALMSISSVW
jgi:hypothetical protein